jgi:hypothetical protein
VAELIRDQATPSRATLSAARMIRSA